MTPANTQIWIVAGLTDLRRGFCGLERDDTDGVGAEPIQRACVVFRGKRGDLIKLLWSDGDGLCLFAKRLERGRFIWPKVDKGRIALTRAQLAMLLEGIDWRRPERTAEPRAIREPHPPS